MESTELYPLVVSDTSKPVREAVGATLANVWQGLVGDKIAAWRLKNAAAVSDKLGQELAKSGQSINLDKIPPGFAFSWFDKASQADEPELQDLFAKLLANAASGNTDAINKRNVDLVSSMLPNDAKALRVLGDWYKKVRQKAGDRAMQFYGIPIDRSYHTWLEKEGLEDKSAVDNLISLGVVRIEKDVQISRQEIARIEKALISSASSITRATSRSSSISTTVKIDPSRLLETNQRLMLTTAGRSLIDALFPDGC